MTHHSKQHDLPLEQFPSKVAGAIYQDKRNKRNHRIEEVTQRAKILWQYRYPDEANPTISIFFENEHPFENYFTVIMSKSTNSPRVLCFYHDGENISKTNLLGKEVGIGCLPMKFLDKLIDEEGEY